MKRKFSIYLSSLFVIGLLFYGCGAANPAASCSPYVGGTGSCGDIQACCTSTNCWYKHDGKKYNCNGLDCTQAAQDVVNAACDFGAGIEDVKGLENLAAETAGKL